MIKLNNPSYYINGVLAGNISILSRAITIIESALPAHQKIAQQILSGIAKHNNTSFRLGITGVPGVGKSTFIESFGKILIQKNYKIAVLAIDPSSNISKGSILGDKTRMEDLSKEKNVFIRPSPSSGTLGGVAKATYETMLLCEAAGYDFIIIETVGVGQSETMVSQLTDFFLLLMLAGAGDELQGIKRGIMELADAIVITKADGANINKANSARAEYAHALHLFPPNLSGWIPQVLTCSSTENKGLEQVYTILDNYKNYVTNNGYFFQKRKNQLLDIFHYFLLEKARETFYNNEQNKNKIALAIESINNGNTSVFNLINNI